MLKYLTYYLIYDLNAFAFVFRLFGTLVFHTVLKIFNLKNQYKITIVIFRSFITVNFNNLFKVIDFLAPMYKNITIELLPASASVFSAPYYTECTSTITFIRSPPLPPPILNIL